MQPGLPIWKELSGNNVLKAMPRDPRDPVPTLLCLLLLLQGMCHTHAVCCGGGTGLFFLPKNTHVLVMRKVYTTFILPN